MKLTPKNWDNFQHYKHRSPPWIKLHKNLLDDMLFQRLPVASKALAPMLWLLASESNDGVISKTAEEIAFRLRMTEKDVLTAIKPLIDNGFFINASNVLASSLQGATTETEKSRVESTSYTDSFERFWKAYPSKVGKGGAFKSWQKLKPTIDLQAKILEAIEAQKSSKKWQEGYIKNPQTWLNERCWEDEVITSAPKPVDNMFKGLANVRS